MFEDPKMAVRTVKSCLRYVQKQLTLRNIDESSTNAQYLVAHALGQKAVSWSPIFVNTCTYTSFSFEHYSLFLFKKKKTLIN